MSYFLITGGTGLIGSALCDHLLKQNHQVAVLSRQPPEQVLSICGQVNAINQLDQIPQQQNIDVVINLAGAPIADRLWSKARKQQLEHSRIQLTADLVSWLNNRDQKPECFISGSAIGWYGDQADKILSETSSHHDEYTHQLCEQWEQQALAAAELGIRTCIIRTGLVLSAKGGMLKRMLLPFKLGVGGRFGNGEHYMSWIHIDDMVNLISFLATNQHASGVYNATAPTPVTNREFTQTLAKQLHRPAFFTTPKCILTLALGEMSCLLVTGQRVLPEKSQAEGFEFVYTKLDAALANLLP